MSAASPSKSPSRPLADLSISHQNMRATVTPPPLSTPTKTHGDESDLFSVNSTVKSTTTKSSRTMTIRNGEVVESTYQSTTEKSDGGDFRQSQEFYDAQDGGDAGDVEIDLKGDVPSSPFENTVEIDIPSNSGAEHSPISSPSPVKSRKLEETAEEGDSDESVIHHQIDAEEEGMSTIYHGANDHISGADDTEFTFDVGDLSTFSAVPNADMTLFAGLRGSPTKTGAANWSPGKQLRPTLLNTPSTARRSSPRKDSFEDDATPRRPGADTTDLLNFTGQSNIFPPPQSTPRTSRRSPSGRGAFPVRVSPTKSHAQVERERAQQPSAKSDLFDLKPTPMVPETPSRRNNLLDLDIDPLPTPRSVPSITPRELESLRSELTSQISALRATLSGKEAEVSALKRAITDAEVRCGTALEDVRNEKSKVGELESEREAWRERQVEMEAILRDVRQEVMIRARDAEKSERKAEEMEKKVGDWEGRNRELEAQVETMRRRVAAAATAASGSDGLAAGDVTMKLMDVDAAVKDATERVARELHALYKGKHETKVAALKKSYEARWEKRVKELEKHLQEAQEEVVTLKTERDATISAPIRHDPAAEVEKEKLKQAAEHLEAEKQILEAKLQGLESELGTTKEESALVRIELEKQRSENGELVAAVDAMLALQDEMSSSNAQTSTQSAIESLRGSIRASSHPHPHTSGQQQQSATVSVPGTPRSAIKKRPMSMQSGLKPPTGLPGPRVTGIPTSASSSGLARPGSVAGRLGGTRGGTLADGIRMMGAGSSR